MEHPPFIESSRAPTGESQQPNVVWRPNPGPQTKFLSSSAYEVLFGGASGGGKSAAIIAMVLRWVTVPYFRGLILRRETTQLQDLLDKSRALYPNVFPGCVFNANTNTWIFPSGARVRFNHCKEESDKYDYQGQEFQLVVFDELTHFSIGQYLEISSRIRSAGVGLPRYLRATSNPGGNGHEWVFKRFGAWLNPKFEAAGLVPRFDPNGERLPPAMPGQKLWVLSTKGDGEVYVPAGHPEALSRQFIPALLKDNPKLLENDPTYRVKIMQLDPVRRAQLLDGNWLAATGKKLYFDRAWVEMIDASAVPRGLHWVRAWDLAATAPSSDNPDPDWTRGVKLALLPDGRALVADVASTRAHPGEVDAFLLATAKEDGGTCTQVVPQDPGAAGKGMAAHVQTLLRGYPVSVVRPSDNKLGRFRPFSGFAAPPRRGVVVVNAAWNTSYFNELEAFEGKPNDRDDQVDATSDAFNEAADAPPTVEPADPDADTYRLGTGRGF